MKVGEQLGKNQHTLKLIHINDIRPNPLNKFHIYEEEVRALAEELELNGVNNGRVYYQEMQNDSKHYTLIGGETRYHALKLLYNEGRHDGYFPMYVIDEKPQTELDELDLIMADNHQRFLSEEDKKVIIQDYEKIYEYRKAQDKELDKAIQEATNPLQKELLEEKRHIPKNTVKRDWIAMKTGFINRNGSNISGRQVQKYLTGKYAKGSDATSKDNKDKKQTSVNEEQKRVFDSLKKHLVDVTDATVQVTSTKLTISYANIYDLHRILEAIKYDEEIDMYTKLYRKRGR